MLGKLKSLGHDNFQIINKKLLKQMTRIQIIDDRVIINNSKTVIFFKYDVYYKKFSNVDNEFNITNDNEFIKEVFIGVKGEYVYVLSNIKCYKVGFEKGTLLLVIFKKISWNEFSFELLNKNITSILEIEINYENKANLLFICYGSQGDFFVGSKFKDNNGIITVEVELITKLFSEIKQVERINFNDKDYEDNNYLFIFLKSVNSCFLWYYELGKDFISDDNLSKFKYNSQIYVIYKLNERDSNYFYSEIEITFEIDNNENNQRTMKIYLLDRKFNLIQIILNCGKKPEEISRQEFKIDQELEEANNLDKENIMVKDLIGIKNFKIIVFIFFKKKIFLFSEISKKIVSQLKSNQEEPFKDILFYYSNTNNIKSQNTSYFNPLDKKTEIPINIIQLFSNKIYITKINPNDEIFVEKKLYPKNDNKSETDFIENDRNLDNDIYDEDKYEENKFDKNIEYNEYDINSLSLSRLEILKLMFEKEQLNKFENHKNKSNTKKYYELSSKIIDLSYKLIRHSLQKVNKIKKIIELKNNKLENLDIKSIINSYLIYEEYYTNIFILIKEYSIYDKQEAKRLLNIISVPFKRKEKSDICNIINHLIEYLKLINFIEVNKKLKNTNKRNSNFKKFEHENLIKNALMNNTHNETADFLNINDKDDKTNNINDTMNFNLTTNSMSNLYPNKFQKFSQTRRDLNLEQEEIKKDNNEESNESVKKCYISYIRLLSTISKFYYSVGEISQFEHFSALIVFHMEELYSYYLHNVSCLYIIIKSCINLSLIFYNNENIGKSIALLEYISKLKDKSNQTLSTLYTICNYNIGILYYLVDNYSESKIRLDYALKNFNDEIDNTHVIGIKIYMAICEIELEYSNYNSSYENIIKACKLIDYKINNGNFGLLKKEKLEEINSLKYKAFILTKIILEKINNSDIYRIKTSDNERKNKILLDENYYLNAYEFFTKTGQYEIFKNNKNFLQILVENQRTDEHDKHIDVNVHELEKLFLFISKLNPQQVSILNETQEGNIEILKNQPLLFSYKFKNTLNHQQRLELNSLKLMGLRRNNVLKDPYSFICIENLKVSKLSDTFHISLFDLRGYNNIKRFLNQYDLTNKNLNLINKIDKSKKTEENRQNKKKIENEKLFIDDVKLYSSNIMRQIDKYKSKLKIDNIENNFNSIEEEKVFSILKNLKREELIYINEHPEIFIEFIEKEYFNSNQNNEEKYDDVTSKEDTIPKKYNDNSETSSNYIELNKDPQFFTYKKDKI